MISDLFKAIIEHASDAILVTDSGSIDAPHGPKIIYVNDSYLKMTGYAREEVIGKTPRILQGPETQQSELKILRIALEQNKPGHAELINYRKNGETFWSSISIFPVSDTPERTRYWIGIKRDITALKETQEKLKHSLDEKTALLQEVHHRVKNNLAVISALTQLQTTTEPDNTVRKKLLAHANRIKTMASVHETLYQSDSFSNLDMSENIRTICRQRKEELQPEFGVDFEFDSDSVFLNINQAVPLSMIVNEVISNSLIHAFPDTARGTIKVGFNRTGQVISLTVQDNGIGFSDGKLQNEPAFGMELIDTLTRQLEADYTYSSEPDGTSFELQFSIQED